jgi:cell wall-associated NlpC family hydrolase
VQTAARTGLTALAIVASLAFCSGGANADPGGPGGPGTPPAPGATPSQAQVDQANQDVATRVVGVAAIRATLVQANDRLEAASTRAEIAAERYNEATWKLGQARTALTAAAAKATAATQAVKDQRAGIADLVVQNFRGGPQVDQLSMMLDVSDPAQVLQSYGAVHSATTSMDASYDRYRSSLSLARVARQKAVTAKAAAAELAAGARKARDTAAAVQDSAQAETRAVQAQTDRLTRRLAKAQGISVRLARTRQVALDRAAAIRAAQVKAAAEQAAVVKAQQEAAAQAQQQADQQAQQAQQPKADPTPGPSPSGDPTPTPTPTPTPAPPAPGGGAASAIAFAKAQIGEPYKWAAAGPSSWDCSGLMMMAWQAAGKALPHYSAGQYAATTHITRAQLQPGDLIFWGTSSSPSSIHHVAMYLGDNMMIHAPRTGQDVMIASVDYWIPPNFFGRP